MSLRRPLFGVLLTSAVTLVGFVPAYATAATDACLNASRGDDPRLGYANNDNPSVSTAVWRRTDRLLIGTLTTRAQNKSTLRVCTVAAPRRLRASRSTIRTEGPAIRIARDARLIDAHVADPWIAWATLGPAKTILVHRRKVNAPAATTRTRTFGTTVDTVIATPTGSVVVSMTSDRKQRIVRWTPGRAPRPLTPARRISHAKGAPERLAPWSISSWEPGVIELGEASGIARLIDVDQAGTCRPLDRGAPTTLQASSTNGLRATVDNSTGWSRRVVFDGSEWTTDPLSVETTEHLKICDRAGRRVLGTTTGEREDGYVDEITSLSVAGQAVIASGDEASTGGGSGNSSSVQDTVYVVPPDTSEPVRDRPIAQLPVSTMAGAAWIEQRAVWVSDAAGVRPLPGSADDVSALRIDDGVLRAIRTTGTMVLPFDPLPSSLTAAPTNRVRDGNYGKCSPDERFYSRCAVPPLQP
jgi:hypothetical protein